MNLEDLKIAKLLDLSHTQAKPLFEKYEFPWQVLPQIGSFIIALGAQLSEDAYVKRGEDIWVSKTAKVFDSAYIKGPTIIGPETEIRHCAFIRGNALIGAGCVVGNSTELKNVILFDNVQVPHYNYVGDSVLGFKSHMGAGAITSNVKQDKTLVSVHLPEKDIETGLKKFGAILGDFAEIGCNSVLNPGSVVCRKSNVYPLSMLRGVVPQGNIYKSRGEVVEKF